MTEYADLRQLLRTGSEQSRKLELDLDQVATDLTYSIAELVEGWVQKPDIEITAIKWRYTETALLSFPSIRL